MPDFQVQEKLESLSEILTQETHDEKKNSADDKDNNDIQMDIFFHELQNENSGKKLVEEIDS